MRLLGGVRGMQCEVVMSNNLLRPDQRSSSSAAGLLNPDSYAEIAK